MGKTVLAVVAVAMVALGGAAAALYLLNRPEVLHVAVPSMVEDVHLMASAEHVFNHQHEQIRLRIVPVEDSASAATALESGAADLAVMRSDIALTSSAQTLAILHRNAILLIAPGGTKLRHVGDLRGKRIGVVHEVRSMDPNARLLDAILSQYEISPKAVTMVSLSPGEVRAAVETGRVDAIFAAIAPQNGLVNEILGAIASVSRKPPVFIPISEAKAIAKRFPALEPYEIIQGAFGGDPPRPQAAIDSLSVSALLVARGSLHDSLAAEVTRLFFSHRGAIALTAPLANSIEAPSTDKGSAIPVHQGAADYLDGNERGFFERYSDLFYIGAMLLSLIGSGAAALASRFNTHAHERSEQLTEKLLEVLQTARAAATPTELDDLERQVDEVLTNTLGDRRLRGVEAPGLHLITLALDQARRAIEERRLALTRGREVVNFPSARNLPVVK
ncbi:TAXI family TRAP transporter solute-binding subunit [Methylocystis heyeri]|uniref:C4-dicarboxylate ABC transporter substrate-binding protein n=1 Tax=Methylocystis heyeri TaxID=391905 RepID=A0A6B8KJJ1_9HYPH|nr:TAXI family TRAP transporter solute-binding subunit [Methylocystis heyeri]QGM47699.1 C4-dicarboxylate ABC transporter substrate-binding protein [Methylocystis heyeri]